MVIRSKTVTQLDCEAIAEAMSIQLYNVRDPYTLRDGRNKLQFTLRPTTEVYRAHHNNRRIWAVSWTGHYVFMRAIFALDPSARITSAISDYHGLAEFEAHAWATGYRNIGSQMEPVSYVNATLDPDDAFAKEQDLIDRALRIARFRRGCQHRSSPAR